MIPQRARPRAVLRFAAALLAGAAFLCACTDSDSATTVVWTDVPELALAAEHFNASQERYLVEVQWKDDLAGALRQAKELPAGAMGHYLKSYSVRDRFLALDYLFGELVVNQAAFYPGLLALGNIEGRQLLIPVSFNLPAVVFAKNDADSQTGSQPSTAVKNDFLLSLEDMAGASSAFNQKEKGAYVRMGFSPRWDGNFLCLVVNAAGGSFREGKSLSWNEAGLRSAVESLRSWVLDTNGNAALEDDFQFKYLYTPTYQYVSSGRVLFAYMDSGSFFLVPEEKRSSLDYRWFAHRGMVPVSDGIVYAALPRAGKGRQGAEAFLKWFFKEDSQRSILETARRTRALESSFGIAGGFSSLRSVNERVFPLYYPALVGHMPPADSLAAPNVLPSDWPELKSAVVAPWLVQITGRGAAVDPGKELAARISEYRKKIAPQ